METSRKIRAIWNYFVSEFYCCTWGTCKEIHFATVSTVIKLWNKVNQRAMEVSDEFRE